MNVKKLVEKQIKENLKNMVDRAIAKKADAIVDELIRQKNDLEIEISNNPGNARAKEDLERVKRELRCMLERLSDPI